MKNLSGGQKVKCVIGASMWFCPHIVVLDEPTNYLDRDSLGALSRAIKEFQGGVLMISHNAEFFGDIAPEVWEVPGDQKVHVSGAEWMEAVKAKELADARAKKKSIPKQDDDKFDALGNKIETAVAAADIDRDYVPRPRLLYLQLRGAMDSVSDFESGGCGFESRRSCRRTTIWTDLESEGYGFESRIGLSRRSLPTDVVAEWSKPRQTGDQRRWF